MNILSIPTNYGMHKPIMGGKTGREVAVKGYDWNIIGREVEEVYEGVLNID